MTATAHFLSPPTPRQIVEHAIAHLDHLLPGQAPILNFVHHNTLHGYQHLPFEQALAEAEQFTGIRAWLPEEAFRKRYQEGRIDDADWAAVFAQRPALHPEATLALIGDRAIPRSEVLRISLIHGVEALTPSQLVWQMEELDATRRFQDDVPETVRQPLLKTAGLDSGAAMEELWRACLDAFQLPAASLHPEDLVDLQLNLAKSLLARFRTESNENAEEPVVHQRMQAEAQALIERLCAEVGEGVTLRGLLQTLTGRDLLDEIRPQLIRCCAAHLDVYPAWRRLAVSDLAGNFAGGLASRQTLTRWPEEPVDAIITELRRLGLPESHWAGYLTRLALELPGWSGMMNWRQQHPDYPANRETPVALADYLAVRLCLDGLWIERQVRDTWGLEGSLPGLRTYLLANPAEALVRYALYEGRLPEYLASRARGLIENSMVQSNHPGASRHPSLSKEGRDAWDTLADMIWTWRHSPVADQPGLPTVHGDAWRLFRLAQHLGLSGGELRTLSPTDRERLLAALDELSPGQRGALWQAAYEHHYRDALINALASNHRRWAVRERRPQAQIVFCIDDREEGFRRHLEELNPDIETLGAAGFFGVAMNWRGLDDRTATPLCPVVVTPVHDVREVPRTGTDHQHIHRNQRRQQQSRLRAFYHEIRRNLLSSAPLIAALTPGVLPMLVGKVFAPFRQGQLAEALNAYWVPDAPTETAINAAHPELPATPEQPRPGFTDAEQADRVAGLLRNIGLTSQLAPLVILMGHGSMSQNNPHLGAYDCGACGGRHGGPNARAFAAMANRPAVRALLAERGMVIPADVWLIGAEHNTCDEKITFYDLADLPTALEPAFRECPLMNGVGALPLRRATRRRPRRYAM